MKKGTLTFSVTGPDGTTYSDGVVGPVTVRKTGIVEATRSGTYTVKVTGQEASGDFDVSWTISGKGR